jgi:1,4-alpha-glucan branching enzyme
MAVQSKTNKGKRRITLRFQDNHAGEVCVAGTFNNWDPTQRPMKRWRDERTFTTTMMLPPGQHEYKFVADGTWIADPACPEWMANEHGSLNSVLTV